MKTFKIKIIAIIMFFIGIGNVSFGQFSIPSYIQNNSNSDTTFNNKKLFVYGYVNFNPNFNFNFKHFRNGYVDILYYNNNIIYQNIRNTFTAELYNNAIYNNFFNNQNNIVILTNKWGNRFPLFIHDGTKMSNIYVVGYDTTTTITQSSFNSNIYKSNDSSVYNRAITQKIYTYKQTIKVDGVPLYTLKLDNTGFEEIYHKTKSGNDSVVDLRGIRTDGINNRMSWFNGVNYTYDSTKCIVSDTVETFLCKYTFETKDTTISNGTTYRGIQYNTLGTFTNQFRDTIPNGQCGNVTVTNVNVVCDYSAPQDTILFLQNGTVSFNGKTYTEPTLTPVADTVKSECKIYNITVTMSTNYTYSNFQSDKSINVYPNPTPSSSDGFNIESDTQGKVDIINISGAIIHTQNLDEGVNRIYKQLSPGMYILNINTDTGKTQHKMIVQ